MIANPLKFILIVTSLTQCVPAFAGLIINVQFGDVINSTNVGFDDPTFGLDRRNTIYDVMNYISSQLDSTVYNSSVDYYIGNSEADGFGFLGSSGAYYFTSTFGFFNGFVFDHATTGSDPFDGLPDAVATFDFGYAWHLGTGSNPGGLFDLFSVALHEFTHSMGFSSLIDASGKSAISGGNPGVFAVYDTFLVRGDGTSLFGDGANYLGSVADLTSQDVFFNGPNAVAANSGNPVPIYAPSPFSDGSSIGHVDSSINAVMNYSIAPGVEKRAWTAVDAGILQDIGWQLTSSVPEPSGLVLLGISCLVGFGRSCVVGRRQRQVRL